MRRELTADECEALQLDPTGRSSNGRPYWVTDDLPADVIPIKEGSWQ